ncbi:MAG: bifunctional oligoribonuclease/PAP phosphatase NrnA [Myxococcota bacterium]
MSHAEALALVRQGERFLVACHRRPDADALGSALGFAEVLRALGKEAVIYVPDALPLTLRFLARDDIEREPPTGTFAATFVMDTASKALLPKGLPGPEVRGPLVIVDHHASHDDVGDVRVRDVSACATGEVVMDLAEALGVRPVPPGAATPIYAALVADTGGFRYPATTAKALRLGAELLEGGADPWIVAYELFEGWPTERLQLLSAILDTLELRAEGRLALLRVTRAMLDELGADDDMVEGMVNYGRMIRGVEIAALFWEFPADGGAGIDTKISLRSSGDADVSRIAALLGGGGHRSAAGAQVPEGVAETIERVSAEAKITLDGKG